MPKYNITVRYGTTDFILDTEDDGLKEALLADEIDPNDADSIHDWLLNKSVEDLFDEFGAAADDVTDVKVTPRK